MRLRDQRARARREQLTLAYASLPEELSKTRPTFCPPSSRTLWNRTNLSSRLIENRDARLTPILSANAPNETKQVDITDAQSGRATKPSPAATSQSSWPVYSRLFFGHAAPIAKISCCDSHERSLRARVDQVAGMEVFRDIATLPVDSQPYRGMVRTPRRIALRAVHLSERRRFKDTLFRSTPRPSRHSAPPSPATPPLLKIRILTQHSPARFGPKAC